ncbi:hypothetical protein VNO77_19224 [Canavalia gladiata]|uniref:Uncharacterized protein n=1 Tax=Canavalia gladiata TaxID=3824 RepID=A0AAN9LM16_CANGL
MERKPLLPQLTHPNRNTESESKSVSHTATSCFDFEFPTAISNSAVTNDVVLFGKVIHRGGKNKNPFVLRSESSSGRQNRVSGSVRSASTVDNRWRRSDSHSSSGKHRSGLFGMVKFPLQMELRDMKMRQERREVQRLPLPSMAAGDDGSVSGGKSCWELVRPLRRRSQLMNALTKATFGCITVA